MKTLAIAVLIGVAWLAASAAPARAALQCVRSTDIDQTSVIDDHTILIKLNGRGHYKRADLESPCNGLYFRGFAYSTPNDELCNVNPLHILDGEICMIKDIVDISADEAKDLMKHAKH